MCTIIVANATIIRHGGMTVPTFMRLVNIISRCGAMYRAEEFRDLGLCAPHHSYIISICRHPGVSQEQLAEQICVDKSNVARQLAHLEQEGYIERRQSEADKRAYLVYPTQKAVDALPRVRQGLAKWNEYVTQDLTPEESEQLVAMMEKVADRARQYIREQGVGR